MSEAKANSKHDSTTSLFAYGTLAEPEVMQALLGHVPASCEGHIEGHAAYRMREGVYPGLIREVGKRTAGRLYDAVGSHDMQIIEAFEDDAYERVWEPIVNQQGSPRPALIYRIPEVHRHLLSEQPWDAAAFRSNHLARYVDMCGAFRLAMQPWH